MSANDRRPPRSEAERSSRGSEGGTPPREAQRNTGQATGAARPRVRGRFVGRDHELAAVARAFDDHLRLVTLHGPGGIGKTRLALRHAARAEADGSAVRLCDVSDARGPADLFRRLAIALGASVAELPSEDAASEALARALAHEGRCLLVLDNVEPATAAVAAIVAHWLDLAPECDFLVTSREALRVAGEQIVRVGPLEPADAARLFRDRAAEVCDPARVDAFDPVQVDAIVARLEGNPLAISLAAARTAALSLGQLGSRLDRPLELLVARHRDAGDRHSSLRSTIAASWELLDPAEKRALAACAVFAGPFSLDAAEAVLDEPARALERVEDLHDKSLLGIADDGGEARYSLYDSVREFLASDQVLEGGSLGSQHHRSAPSAPGKFVASVVPEVGDLAPVERRHADHHAARAGALAARLDGIDAAAALRGLERIAGELAAAATRFTRRDPALAAALAVPLARLLAVRGPSDGALPLLASVIESARARGDRAVEARCAWARAMLLRERRQMDAALAATAEAREAAVACGDRSLAAESWLLETEILLQTSRLTEAAAAAAALAQPLADAARRFSGVGTPESCEEARFASFMVDPAPPPPGKLRARGAYALALLDHLTGRGTGPDHYDRAIQLCREDGDARTETRALTSRGALLFECGRLAEAIDTLERARALAAATGGIRVEGLARFSIGEIEYHAGRFAAAESAWQEALALFGRAGFRLGDAFIASSRARLAHERGELARAAELCDEARAIAGDARFLTLEALSAAQLGMLALERGELVAAREQLAAAAATLERSGDRRYAGFVSAVLALATARAGDVDRARDLADSARRQLAGRAPLPAGQIAAVELLAAAIRGEPAAEVAPSLGWEVRLAQRLVSRPTPATPAAPPGLTIGPGAIWFSWRGARVDLSRRGPLRRVLGALAERRSGEPLSVYELLDVGWPGQNVDAESGAQRVYWVIATLRRLGLAGCLVTRDDGYLLDPAVPLRQE